MIVVSVATLIGSNSSTCVSAVLRPSSRQRR